MLRSAQVRADLRRLDGPQHVQRLVAEGVTARDVRHKNIVAVCMFTAMVLMRAGYTGKGADRIGGFVTAFTLAATTLGVATIPQAAVASYPDLIRDHFRIADDRLIFAVAQPGTVVGAYLADAAPSERRPDRGDRDRHDEGAERDRLIQ